MRITALIAEFESKFSISFRHSSRVKYGIDCENSDVSSIKENLNLLEQKLISGEHKTIHVGYNFNVDDVRYLIGLFAKILDEYILAFGGIPSNKKVYEVFNQLRLLDFPNPKAIAKESLDQILVVPTPVVKSRKERMKDDAQNYIKKQNLSRIRKKG